MSHIFKVYAAIDFGTNGTGLAYCIPNDDGGSVYIHDKWSKFKSTKKNSKRHKTDMSNVKPKTAILLDENGTFKSFGDDALKVYMVMQDTKLMLFEHFKMKLYNKPHYTSDKILNILVEDDEDDIDEKGSDPNIMSDDTKDEERSIIREKITAVNGREYPSSKVFVEALKYLKQQAMHVFKRNKLQIKSYTEVCWILTVPAIWDDTAKAQMKTWAIEAGMIDPNIENHLLLRYEPDCASLSIQYEINESLNVPSNIADDPDKDDEKGEHFTGQRLSENEKYILVDAGGGTVDIACHQVLDDNDVKELIHPSGGPWGDFHVDLLFIDLLCDIFKEQWIAEFKVTAPNSYLELMENFRRAKWTFTDDLGDKDEQVHNVQVPYVFFEFMEDKIEDDDSNEYEDVEELVNEFAVDGNRELIECNGDYFNIHYDYWKRNLFDKLIDPTIDLCKDLLADDRMVGCNYLCIVGGFGSNKYFQKRLINAFVNDNEYKLDVIIPRRPILSVIDGAARMAMKTNYVRSRILSYTYGDYTEKNLTLDELKGCPEEWKKKNFKAKRKNGILYRNVFVPWCEKDTEIKVDDPPKTFPFRRLSKFQQSIPFCIYVTDKDTNYWTEKKDLKCLINDKLIFTNEEKKSQIGEYNNEKVVGIIKKKLENLPRLRYFKQEIIDYFIENKITGRQISKMTGTKFTKELEEHIQNYKLRGVFSKLYRSLNTEDSTVQLWADFKVHFGGSILLVTGQVRGRTDTKKKLRVNCDLA